MSGGSTARAIAVESDGSVLVTGDSDLDYATIKYSNAGVPVWTNYYNGPGSSYDYALSVAVDSKGRSFVTGASPSIHSDFSSSDYATVAYSSAGVPLWTNRYNGTHNDYDEAVAVAVSSNSSVFVTGFSFGVGTYYDYATVAYSSAGTPLWTARFGGVEDGDDEPAALAVDSNGNVFVTGFSSDTNGAWNYATVAYSGAGIPL
jgi:hypothetical protein